MAHIPILSYRDSLLLDVVCALTIHQIYRKYEVEPANLPATMLLLVGAPALPCYFLAPYLSTLALGALLSYAIFYVSLVSSIVLYRISPVHPLAKYPGPLSMKISKFVWSYHASTGKQHIVFKKLHDKYGSIVRVGPNELSIVEVDFIPTMMVMRKGPLWNAHHTPGSLPSVVALRDVDLHYKRRKLWNHGFSMTALNGLKPLVQDRVLEFVEELGKRASPPSEEREVSLDLAMWMSNFTVDFMGDMVFSGGFSLMKDGSDGGMRSRLHKFVAFIAVIEHTSWLVGLMRKLLGTPEEVRTTRDFAIRHYDLRKARGATKKDLFYYITNEGALENANVSRSQGLEDIMMAIDAGSDTTATVLSAIFFYLLSNPAVFHRLRKEVDSEFPIGEGDPFDPLKLSRMPFLNAVVHEGLRLQPPVPTQIQRSPLVGSGGVMVAERLLPESTAIYTPPYCYHRDPRYFSPFPNSFIPERWLETEKSKFTTNATAFIPFAAGRGGCAGKNMALMEMRMVVATLVQKFDMKFAEGYDIRKWADDLKDYFSTTVGELPVVLHARFQK